MSNDIDNTSYGGATTARATTDTTSSSNTDDESFEWTVATIAQSIVLFLLAGVAEILGGWMIW